MLPRRRAGMLGMMVVFSRLTAAWKPFRSIVFPLVVAVGLTACARSFDHDEVLAGKRAVEFARVAFVAQDVENGYALLSDAAKRYVPLEKFKETVSRLRPSGQPTNATATDYEPMPGENAIYIYVSLDNSGEQYTITMEGTAVTDYKVSRITRGSGSFLPSTSAKKRFSTPIDSKS